MWDFEEMKEIARKVDEGTNALEKKLANPMLLGHTDDATDAPARACTILDDILKEIDSIDEHLTKFTSELTEDIHEVKEDCEEVEDYMLQIKENVERMEEYGKEYGYAPPAHLMNTIDSDSSDLLSEQFANTVLIGDTTPVLHDSDVQSVTSDSVMRSENTSGVTNATWDLECTSVPTHDLNETFTTPCSVYKMRSLNLPDISSGKSISSFEMPCAIASSSPNFQKPKFNLDETASTVSDAGFTINSSNSSYMAIQPRRLSRFPHSTLQLKTPPEPKLSVYSQMLFHKSAVKKRLQPKIAD